MLALWVKVRVKPEERERFLKAIEVDAIGSERDEPGCLRFNVLQTSRTRTSTTSSKFTGTRLRWRRTGPHHTTPSGARPLTRSTGRPRRRVRYGNSRGARWVRILRPSSMRSFGSMA